MYEALLRFVNISFEFLYTYLLFILIVCPVFLERRTHDCSLISCDYMIAPMYALWTYPMSLCILGAAGGITSRSVAEERDEMFRIGSIDVDIAYGDLTKERTDAIVNSSDNNLILQGVPLYIIILHYLGC